MGLFILGQGLDLTSLFQGLEKFDSLCIRNLIVKLGVLIFIFIFIKNENDYWKYVLIMAGSHLLSSLIMFPVAFKNLDKPTLHLFNPKVYIKELILFGLPNIFCTFIVTFPKTILGVIIKDVHISGYYESAYKLINLITVIVTSANTIMMSRMAYLFTTNNEEDINILTRKTFSLFALISLPCIFGLIGINKYFTPAFFGEEYTSSVSMIYILAPGIFFSSFSDLVVLSLCFVPRGHFWKRTIIYFCIDLFECICVPICVKFLKGNGAALGLLLTQIATALTCFFF